MSVCLDGIEVDFSGESNTLIVRNMDRPGCITEVSSGTEPGEDQCCDDAGVPSQKRRCCRDGRRDRSVRYRINVDG